MFKKLFKILVIIFALIGFSFISIYLFMKMGLTKTEGVDDDEIFVKITTDNNGYASFPLAHTPEWIAFRQAVIKDKSIIEKISKETGISQRLLVSILVPEQMRLFHSNRPLFKEIFSPLKILGSQSQFSWGIFGIKDETARNVEIHLKDKTSPFYLGKKYENILDFKSKEIDEERFQRIIDEHDHTYSYLYTALYILQINKHWSKAGFPIEDKPDIIATLYNLGFDKSKPNKDPKSGGAEIEINGVSYSFGSLAKSFYYSDEMIEVFPK